MELGLSLGGDASTTVGFPDTEINGLELNLLPRRRIKSHLQSRPCSSDKGSSENGSSENMLLGLDVNRIPAPAPEEVSSANSAGSPLLFHMGFGALRMSGNKRSSTAAEEEDDDDDEEENTTNPRKKLRLSKQQSSFLEESFKEHSTLNPKQKLALANQLNLRPRQVEVWFQNRRARTKLKQTEVDCEYLKRCCETLTEENRRLQKELQELRALNTANPFHMQLPATTLTMCPSCERVATSASAVDSVPFPLARPRFYPFSRNNDAS